MNQEVWDFYEHVLTGGDHELTQLLRFPEPQRHAMIAKNLHRLQTMIPQTFTRLKQQALTQIMQKNQLTLMAISGKRKHSHRDSRENRESRKDETIKFRHMLMLANHLAKYARQRYQDMDKLGLAVIRIVEEYRRRVLHEHIRGGLTTMEDIYNQVRETILNPKRKRMFEDRVRRDQPLEMMQKVLESNLEFLEIKSILLEIMDELYHEEDKTYMEFGIKLLGLVMTQKYPKHIQEMQTNFQKIRNKIME